MAADRPSRVGASEELQRKTDRSKEKTGGRTLNRIDGHTYFALVRAGRSQCAMTTIARLPSLGKKAPGCYDNLGRTLALLDQIACCAWGCPGTEEGHAIHRLVGRAVSNGNAGVELALIGQYDESLVNARAVGEVANLLWLFATDPPTLEDWRSLEWPARWRAYRPAEVRRKLRSNGQPLLVEESDYALLSEHAVHVTPMTSPNTIGLDLLPSLGGRYREALFLTSLNEIAWAVGVLSIPAAKLLGPPKDARRVLKTTKKLISSVGGVRMAQVPGLFKLSGLNPA